MITTTELEHIMHQCYGTEQYWVFPIMPAFKYTDGVQHFIDSADAYWFLTDTFCLISQVLDKLHSTPEQEFLAVYLKVSKEGPADLIITDGDSKELKKHHYNSVSVPCGEWTFFFEYGVLLWYMEH